MRWDLTKIYKNLDELNLDVKKINELTDEIVSLKGKLNNRKDLTEFFRLNDLLDKTLSRAFCYVSMNKNLDERNTEASILYQNIYNVYVDVVSRLSFIEPELLTNGYEKLKEIVNSDELKQYSFFVEKLFRNEKYVLSENVEAILANYNKPLNSIAELYDKLATADNGNEFVTLEDGTVLEVNESNFRVYLAKLDSQEDRRRVFEAVFKHYDKHKNTFAGIYDGIMQSELAEVRTRNYDSILESHLYGNNIDKEVFLSLINTTRNNTAPVKRYYNLRKKFFNLKEIHTYDRFLEFAKTDKTYDYESSKNIFFEATKEIGGVFEEYSHKVLENGRVDVEIKDGKRGGAYSTGLYDEGPFILLNHNGSLDSVFTLAHEAGHSMHTMFSNNNQPYVTHDYVIFVAEIASTFNETLLLDHLMKQDIDKNTKICLLQQSIDNILSTFYRQSLFATYEYEAHKLVEEGKAITYESLSNIMKQLYKDYYDIDLNNEPLKEFVWAYIPHFFHTPFYVYQYATSFAASQRFYEMIKNNEENAFDNYINLLKSGGSDYPINLVKKAGVDLTKADSFLAVVKRLEVLVDELEELLK